MEYLTDNKWSPTWQDKNSMGREIPVSDIVLLMSEIPPHEGGGLVSEEDTSGVVWKHIDVIATLYAESGFYEWARPIVYDPGRPHHHSVDRGICAFNSHWWSHIDDEVVYDWKEAIRTMLKWLQTESSKGTKGSKIWSWGPLLDWQWHGYDTDRYKDYLGTARAAVNKLRVELELPRI